MAVSWKHHHSDLRGTVMSDLILTSGALLDYARENKIGPVNVDRFLVFQAAYSLAVLRETAVASAVRDPVGGWVCAPPKSFDEVARELHSDSGNIPVLVSDVLATPELTPEPAKPEPKKRKGWPR
jgi:hypothetical protein